MLCYRFGEVLRVSIDLLLEEEKGCTDGTQLSFVNHKGELLHWGASVSQLSCQANDGCGGSKAVAYERYHLTRAGILLELSILGTC
jgi:hypothetical protein